MRHLREDIRRRGGDHHKVRTLRKSNVLRLPVQRFREHLVLHGIAAQRAERERRHELLRVIRHDDVDIVTVFHQQPHQLARLIGGNRPGDPYDDLSCHAG